jgi:hypothetical protein
MIIGGLQKIIFQFYLKYNYNYGKTVLLNKWEFRKKKYMKFLYIAFSQKIKFHFHSLYDKEKMNGVRKHRERREKNITINIRLKFKNFYLKYNLINHTEIFWEFFLAICFSEISGHRHRFLFDISIFPIKLNLLH